MFFLLSFLGAQMENSVNNNVDGNDLYTKEKDNFEKFKAERYIMLHILH